MIVALSPSVASLIDQTQGSHELKEELKFCVRFYSTPGLLFDIVRRIIEVVCWVFSDSYWGQSVALLRFVAGIEKGEISKVAAEKRLWQWIEMNSSPQPAQTEKTEAAVAATLSPAPQSPPSSVQPKPSEATVAATPESEEEAHADSVVAPTVPPPKTPSFQKLWTPKPVLYVPETKPAGSPVKALSLNEVGRNQKAMLKRKKGKPLVHPKDGTIKEYVGVAKKKVVPVEQPAKPTSAAAPAARNPHAKKPAARPPQSSPDLPA